MTGKYFIHAGVVFATGLMTACSSSDSNGGQTDLSSPDVVAKQVSNIVATTSSISGSTGAKSLQNGQCDSGSQSQFEDTGVNVHSPYTAQTFDLSGIEYVNCRQNDENSSVYIEFDGVSRGGFVSDGNDFIDYFSLGDGNSPFSFTVHSQEGGVSSDSTFNFDLAVHALDLASGDYESQMFLLYGGSVGTSGFNADFSVRFGAADTDGRRFVISETANGVSVDGEYAIRLDDLIDGQLQCSGSATIATNSPLQSDGSTTLFSGGEIELSSGGQTATVTFNSDDSVTISASGGSRTLTQTELLNEGAECAGFYGGGFAYIR